MLVEPTFAAVSRGKGPSGALHFSSAPFFSIVGVRTFDCRTDAVGGFIPLSDVFIVFTEAGNIVDLLMVPMLTSSTTRLACQAALG